MSSADSYELLSHRLEENDGLPTNPSEWRKGKTIAVDFDGVLHAYSKGWGDGTIYDGPVPGAAQSMKRLTQAGFYILIYTTRGNTQADKVVEWLNHHGIPFDELYRGEKPIYTAIIDDRAVRFNPRPPWWKSMFGLMSPWSICEMTLERLGIIKPGQGEEP